MLPSSNPPWTHLIPLLIRLHPPRGPILYILVWTSDVALQLWVYNRIILSYVGWVCHSHLNTHRSNSKAWQWQCPWPWLLLSWSLPPNSMLWKFPQKSWYGIYDYHNALLVFSLSLWLSILTQKGLVVLSGTSPFCSLVLSISFFSCSLSDWIWIIMVF